MHLAQLQQADILKHSGTSCSFLSENDSFSCENWLNSTLAKVSTSESTTPVGYVRSLYSLCSSFSGSRMLNPPPQPPRAECGIYAEACAAFVFDVFSHPTDINLFVLDIILYYFRN